MHLTLSCPDEITRVVKDIFSKSISLELVWVRAYE